MGTKTCGIGSQIRWAKMTEAKVRELRQRADAGEISYPRAAREYGISMSTARDIINGVTWRHCL